MHNDNEFDLGDEEEFSQEEIEAFNAQELRVANKAHVLSCVTEMMAPYNQHDKIERFRDALDIADNFMQSTNHLNTTKQ